eukprot:297039_1
MWLLLSTFAALLSIYPNTVGAIPGYGHYELILDHKNVANGYFSSSLKTTGLENQNDPFSNTYSIIGYFSNNSTLRNQYFGTDGRILFKMVYHYDNYPDDILIWKQSSWITSSTVSSSNLFGVPDQSNVYDSTVFFYGLGLNIGTYSSDSYLDGNGGANEMWHNAVGVMSNTYFNGYIPGFNPTFLGDKAAHGQSLYIFRPTDLDQTPCGTNKNCYDSHLYPENAETVAVIDVFSLKNSIAEDHIVTFTSISNDCVDPLLTVTYGEIDFDYSVEWFKILDHNLNLIKQCDGSMDYQCFTMTTCVSGVSLGTNRISKGSTYSVTLQTNNELQGSCCCPNYSFNAAVSLTCSAVPSLTKAPSKFPTESPTYQVCNLQELDWNALNTVAAQLSEPIITSSWD